MSKAGRIAPYFINDLIVNNTLFIRVHSVTLQSALNEGWPIDSSSQSKAENDLCFRLIFHPLPLLWPWGRKSEKVTSSLFTEQFSPPGQTTRKKE